MEKFARRYIFRERRFEMAKAKKRPTIHKDLTPYELVLEARSRAKAGMNLFYAMVEQPDGTRYYDDGDPVRLIGHMELHKAVLVGQVPMLEND